MYQTPDKILAKANFIAPLNLNIFIEILNQYSSKPRSMGPNNSQR